MAGVTRTVGRVSLRVLPDTSRLREDIQKVITRIERTMKATIRTELDTDRLRGEAQRAIAIIEQALKADIKVNLDTTGLGAEITAARDRIEASVKDVTATIKADLDAAIARAQLAAFTERPRRVSIIASMNEGSLAKVQTMLSALSGGRAVGKILDNVGDSLKNLDKAVPSIAAVTLAVGNLAAAALSSVAGLFAVGASIAAISGSFLALPGVVGGFGVGITALVLALVDMKTQLGSLGPAFVNLQNVTSAAFWNTARQPILDMANNLLPALTAGFAGTGKALGGFFADFASNLSRTLGGGVLEGMFSSLNSSIDIARQAMSPLTELIATLGRVGASYLPGLAQNFVDVTTKINEVIQAAAGDGSLKQWIDNGIREAGNLFSAFGGIARILNEIANAAQLAGTGGLATFAAQMHGIADIIATPVFQGALAEIFRGSNEAMKNLSASLGPLGDLIVSMAPTISSALAQLGQTAALLIGGLAQALNTPAVAVGVSLLVQGIKTGVMALGPALAPLSTAFSTLLPVVGTLAGVIGAVLGAALSALAPVLTLILQTVQPLIVLLGTALVGTIGQLAPLLMGLAQAVLPALSTVIQALVPALATVIGSVLPVIAALMPSIASLLTIVATAIATLLPVVAGLVAQLVTSLAPVLLMLVSTLLPVVAQVFAALVPAIAGLVVAIGPLVAVFVEALMPTFAALMPLVETVFAVIVPIITAAIKIITGVIQIFAGFISGDFTMMWQGLKNLVGGVWDALIAIISGALVLAGQIILTALKLIVNTFVQLWGSLAGIVSGAFSAVLNAVTSYFTKVGTFIGQALAALLTLFKTIWETMPGVVIAVLAAMLMAIGAGLDSIVSRFTGLRGVISGIFNTAATWLLASGQKIIDGLIDGIKSKAGAVKDAVEGVLAAARRLLPFSPAKEGPFSGKGWTLYSGRSIAESLAEGITSRQGMVKSAALGMVSAARPLLAEVSSSSFTPAAATAASSSSPTSATFVLVDQDGQIMSVMQGVATATVGSAQAAAQVASRMGAA